MPFLTDDEVRGIRGGWGLGGLVVGLFVMFLLVFVFGFLRSLANILVQSTVVLAFWSSQAIFLVINLLVIILWVLLCVVVALVFVLIISSIFRTYQDQLKSIAVNVNEIAAHLLTKKLPTSMPIFLACIVQSLVLILSATPTLTKVFLSIAAWSFAFVLAMTTSKAAKHQFFGFFLLGAMSLSFALALQYYFGVDTIPKLMVVCAKSGQYLVRLPITDWFAIVMIIVLLSAMLVARLVYR